MPTKRKSGLGSGLNELIPQKNKSTAENIDEKGIEKTSDIKVDINKVEPNKEQPRQYFDEDKLLELSESIRQYGVIQPILVQKRDNYYEIVAGERRWRAAKMAGLKEVPVIIKEFTEQEIRDTFSRLNAGKPLNQKQLRKTSNQTGIIEIRIKEDKEHICLRESKISYSFFCDCS